MAADLPRPNPMNRREFLESSAKNAAGVAAGIVSLAGAASALAGPSERVSVAVIGVRSQGKELASTLASLPDVNVSVLCDVDESLLGVAAKTVEQAGGNTPSKEQDFRRVLDNPSVDAVVIATPDHWHALMTVLACQAGKDVYVEKPVSHNFHEGEVMVTAARNYQRVVQAGLQQRSGDHFRSAIEVIRSGQLGAVHVAKAWTVHQRKPIGFKRDCPVPSGVDYDLWLGPAAVQAFNPNRFHYNWRWFWEYGSGELGNWGVHMLDVARWGLGVELPSQISATGGKHYFSDDQETPDTLVVNYGYPGKTITWEHRLWSPHGQEGRSAAVAFYGDLGTLIVDRGGWKIYGRKETLAASSSELTQPHLQDFIRCVKTREQPVCGIETGHVSSGMCHLGNIAYRLGRSVNFDPASGHFISDPEADLLLSREYRSAWNIPSLT